MTFDDLRQALPSLVVFVFVLNERHNLETLLSTTLSSRKLINKLCFLIGPGRTLKCSLYIYTSHYLIENFTVRWLFSMRADIGMQITTFFATNNCNSLSNTHKLCVSCSSVVQ